MWVLKANVASMVVLILSAMRCGFSATTLSLQRASPTGKMSEIKKRDNARHSRLFPWVATFPLQGDADPYSYGVYFTKIGLGSPPKQFNLLIDTGSHVSWVTCKPCNNCPESSGFTKDLKFFDATTSSSASLISCTDHPKCTLTNKGSAYGCSTKSNTCKYWLQYGDGSQIWGYYVSDLMSFDIFLPNNVMSNASASIVFGCNYDQFGMLLTSQLKGIDGLFGLDAHQLSVISQLSSQGITSKVFSHCLKREDDGGGTLVFGEIMESGILYTPLVKSTSHYNIIMEGIMVNGKLLPIDPSVFATSSRRGTVIDSGTTLMYLVAEAYDSLVIVISSIALKSGASFKEEDCYLVSSSVINIFPQVRLNFAGGAFILLNPHDYLMLKSFNDTSTEWCLGFKRREDMTILGEIVLRDKIIVYDLVRHRIGMGSYNCSLSLNVSQNSAKDTLVNAGNLNIFEMILMGIATLLCIL